MNPNTENAESTEMNPHFRDSISMSSVFNLLNIF